MAPIQPPPTHLWSDTVSMVVVVVVGQRWEPSYALGFCAAVACLLLMGLLFCPWQANTGASPTCHGSCSSRYIEDLCLVTHPLVLLPQLHSSTDVATQLSGVGTHSLPAPTDTCTGGGCGRMGGWPSGPQMAPGHA